MVAALAASRMGHSDATVTLREYGHLFAGVQERLSEQLEESRARSAAATPGVTLFRSVLGAPQDALRTHQDAKTGSGRGLNGQLMRSKNPG